LSLIFKKELAHLICRNDKGLRVRDRGVCLSSCCFIAITLSSLELEAFCAYKTEQSEPRQPDPFCFAPGAISLSAGRSDLLAGSKKQIGARPNSIIEYLRRHLSTPKWKSSINLIASSS